VSLAVIRTAIADALNAAGIRCSSSVPDQLNPPQAVVWRRQIDYEQVLGEGTTYQFYVTVYGAANTRAAQIFLDECCEPDSVLVTTLTAPATAAAADVDYIRVISAMPVTVHDVGGVSYLATEFDVQAVG